MDFKKNDIQLQKLAKEHEEYKRMLDPRAVAVLRKMLTQAEKTGDEVLLGYVHHSLAFAYCFIENDYPAFLRHIRKSAKFLVSARDEKELFHVFYLVAIDAMNRGMYDIAYDYFLVARNMALRQGERLSAAILDESIGSILLELRSYEASCFYSERALNELQKFPEHPHYYSNMLGTMLNEGAAYLAMKKPEKATACRDDAVEFATRHQDHVTTASWFELHLFRARCALRNGQQSEMRKCIFAFCALTPSAAQMEGHSENIRILCEELLEHEEYDELQKIFRLTDAHPPAESSLNARYTLVNLKADYYHAVGNTKKLNACYREQDEIYLRLQEEQKDANRFANDLISLFHDLRREQLRIREEREAFLEESERDALTGLRNRRSLDEEAERVFERAYPAKTPFGIAILDLDDLKQINDSYGHAAGDNCLKRVGKALKQIQSDRRVLCARFGGDEFVMLFEGMRTEEIRAACREVAKHCGTPVSIGICNAVPHKKSRITDYFSCADTALYRAKQEKGRKTAPASRIRSERLHLSGIDS
ncbi:MAG: GGDEF domain-containing protein [Lachnospiraceae bacterium]|nr:GGDEF domain-containing protein [Lachnospiraceae bacterium]